MIGAGMGMKPHALSLIDLADRAEVIGLFSRSTERRAAARAAYGFPVSDDLAGLIASPAVDAVLILTPPAAHLEDFLDALEQNREPLVTGAEAMKVHLLIDAILTSSAERRPVRVGTLPG